VSDGGGFLSRRATKYAYIDEISPIFLYTY
jgi:hypothetical protein